MKKILIVDNSSWNIYNFRLPHIAKMRAAGYKVFIATPVDEYIGKLNKGIYDHYIPLKHLIPQKKNPFQDLLLIWELIRLYNREKPDLVIHFTIKPNIYGSLAARLLKLSAISVVTGLGYTFLHPSGMNRIVLALYKLAFKRIKKLVVYNNDDKEEFVHRNIINPEKCVVIPGSGINTNYFRPLTVSKENRPFIFLYIGRLLKDKGLPEFVEAAKTLSNRSKDLEFWVIGNFTNTNPSAIRKDQLFKWVEGGYIKYFGFANDVRSYLKHADVMVLPSHRGEGVPRSILEAMAMEKPIITTQTAGCGDTVVYGVNGLLVPVGDTAALTHAMTALYFTSRSELKAMGRASRERAIHIFDDKLIATSFLKLVEEIAPFQEYHDQRAGSTAVF